MGEGMILVLFGIALGISLNKLKHLAQRVEDLELFIEETFFKEKE
jgi:hypothetical protein